MSRDGQGAVGALRLRALGEALRIHPALIHPGRTGSAAALRDECLVFGQAVLGFSIWLEPKTNVVATALDAGWGHNDEQGRPGLCP